VNLIINFNAALKKLNIEDYKIRIFDSNSHGELMHLQDYVIIAESFDDCEWFRPWFIGVITSAEKYWHRPESIFQHILKILNKQLEGENNAIPKY